MKKTSERKSIAPDQRKDCSLQDAHPLIPRLRFPEFRDAGEWVEKRLGNQGEFLSSLTGKTAKDFDTGEAKFVTYMNVFSNVFTDPNDLRAVSVESDESQNAVAKGDVFFTVSSETPDETGMSSVLLEDIENCYLNSFCALFRFDEGKLPELLFLGYMLRSAIPREHLARSAQGSTRFNLSKGSFRDVPLLLPEHTEQQKIADCLASLDDLIAAEGRKLTALRDHKRGLMQQLFPQPGQSQPRLRFPEFRGKGTWEIVMLSQVVEIGSGQVDPTEAPYCHLPHVGGENIESHTGNLRGVTNARELGLISGKYPFDGRDILYSKIRPVLNKVAAPDFQGICSADIYPIRSASSDLRREYLYYLLLTESFLSYATKHSARSKIPKINRVTLLAFEASIPPPVEQQRIADCLTALDTQITAQTAKIESLKTHKRGLMQQLFPTPEDN